VDWSLLARQLYGLFSRSNADERQNLGGLSLESTLYRILEILCVFQSNVVPQVAIVSAMLS
jgi:hypothetical protein